MATISNTPRPGYVWDVTDNVWYPIGVGGHSHSEIASTIADAKGDLIAGTAADTVARLAVGTNNHTLIADSAEATGLKYAAGSKATLTTTGDILYASAANTPARLGIGSSAQVLTVASGVPSWATASSGLTLIKRASTSGAANTGTTFDGVFTSTYTAYIVVIEKWTAATSTNAGLFQFRVGAVTRATSYYGGGVEINRDNTETYNGEVNTTSRTLVTNLGDTALPHTAITLNLTDMFQATVPSGYWTGIGGSTGFGTTSAISGSLIVDANTAFDGFLLSASSNIACTVSVYGLAK